MSNKTLWIAGLFMDSGFWPTISPIFISVAIVLLTVFASISIVIESGDWTLPSEWRGSIAAHVAREAR
jgi:hypothetical protein